MELLRHVVRLMHVVPARPLFISVGVLSFAASAIAVLW
jgi:hypothetical protein